MSSSFLSKNSDGFSRGRASRYNYGVGTGIQEVDNDAFCDIFDFKELLPK
jgi:hypothetical protein